MDNAFDLYMVLHVSWSLALFFISMWGLQILNGEENIDNTNKENYIFMRMLMNTSAFVATVLLSYYVCRKVCPLMPGDRATEWPVRLIVGLSSLILLIASFYLSANVPNKTFNLVSGISTIFTFGVFAYSCVVFYKKITKTSAESRREELESLEQQKRRVQEEFLKAQRERAEQAKLEQQKLEVAKLSKQAEREANMARAVEEKRKQDIEKIKQENTEISKDQQERMDILAQREQLLSTKANEAKLEWEASKGGSKGAELQAKQKMLEAYKNYYMEQANNPYSPNRTEAKQQFEVVTKKLRDTKDNLALLPNSPPSTRDIEDKWEVESNGFSIPTSEDTENDVSELTREQIKQNEERLQQEKLEELQRQYSIDSDDGRQLMRQPTRFL